MKPSALLSSAETKPCSPGGPGHRSKAHVQEDDEDGDLQRPARDLEYDIVDLRRALQRELAKLVADQEVDQERSEVRQGEIGECSQILPGGNSQKGALQSLDVFEAETAGSCFRFGFHDRSVGGRDVQLFGWNGRLRQRLRHGATQQGKKNGDENQPAVEIPSPSWIHRNDTSAFRIGNRRLEGCVESRRTGAEHCAQMAARPSICPPESGLSGPLRAQYTGRP